MTAENFFTLPSSSINPATLPSPLLSLAVFSSRVFDDPRPRILRGVTVAALTLVEQLISSVRLNQVKATISGNIYII